MTKRLAGKVAIVTGSTRGIGEAIAKLFAQHGAAVTVSGRSERDGARVLAEIEAGGGTAQFIRCDVSVEADLENLAQQTAGAFGPVTVLVNNAANTKSQGGDVVAYGSDAWDYDMKVDLKAAFLLSKLCVPMMREAQAGSIIHISSVGGTVAWPGSVGYLTAKGGLNQLTKAMAVDHGKDNIRVNAILPGIIHTSVEDGRIQDPDNNKRLREQTVLDRIGRPEEVAYAALFLASDESSYVTGAHLLVDGGWTLR